MAEYIDALCNDAQLAAELSFVDSAAVSGSGGGGVVMCSIVDESVHIPANVVIEFCKEWYSRTLKN